MKKIWIACLATVMLLTTALSGCSGTLAGLTTTVDVDLTALNSTMVYAEVYQMMTVPEDYLGKTVKMQGNFSVYEDEEINERYFACIIADATACCQQGLEFIPKSEFVYPKDFPEEGEDILVVGEFETYTAGDRVFCRLKNCQINTDV